MLNFRMGVTRESLEWIRKKPEEMRKSLIPAMEKCMKLAEADSKRSYLSGPRPLRLDRRTGRLRSSITTRVGVSGNKIKGDLGTNVVYGRAHEQGFAGTVQVRSHLRQGRAVVAHTRRVNLKARPFLRPALVDNLEKFQRIFRQAILEAFDR